MKEDSGMVRFDSKTIQKPFGRQMARGNFAVCCIIPGEKWWRQDQNPGSGKKDNSLHVRDIQEVEIMTEIPN